MNGRGIRENPLRQYALQLIPLPADDQLRVRRCEEQSAHGVSLSFDHNITIRNVVQQDVPVSPDNHGFRMAAAEDVIGHQVIIAVQVKGDRLENNGPVRAVIFGIRGEIPENAGIIDQISGHKLQLR